jgi:hypothetical protein
LEEVTSYKYLGIDIHHVSLAWVIALRKGLLGDGNLIMGLETIVNHFIFGYDIRRKSSLRLLLHMLFYMDVKYGDAISLMNPRER